MPSPPFIAVKSILIHYWKVTAATGRLGEPVCATALRAFFINATSTCDNFSFASSYLGLGWHAFTVAPEEGQMEIARLDRDGEKVEERNGVEKENRGDRQREEERRNEEKWTSLAESRGEGITTRDGIEYVASMFEFIFTIFFFEISPGRDEILFQTCPVIKLAINNENNVEQSVIFSYNECDRDTSSKSKHRIKSIDEM